MQITELQKWIQPYGEIEQTSDWIIQKFLIDSLSVGSSIRTRGFIDELKIVSSVQVQVLMDKMLEGIQQKKFFDAPKEVQKSIENDYKGLFDAEYEFIICTRTDSENLRHAVESLDGYKVFTQLGNKDEVKFVKRRFYELDGLLRHLRNSLAHGQFKLLDSSKMLRLFDLNEKKSLTAIGQLSLKRLQGWYEEFCKRAKRKL